MLEQKDRVIEEFWSRVVRNTLEGNSTTKKNNTIIERESMSIIQDASGNFNYRAKLPKQKEVLFRLVKSDSISAVFENLKHDFPQRISYRRSSEDSLTAVIEGTVKGKHSTIVFPYKKVVVNAD